MLENEEDMRTKLAIRAEICELTVILTHTFQYPLPLWQSLIHIHIILRVMQLVHYSGTTIPVSCV